MDSTCHPHAARYLSSCLKSRKQLLLIFILNFELGGGSTTALGFGLSSSHFDSSSTNSSCSSSTPSSPALVPPPHIANQTPPSASQHTQFRFPGIFVYLLPCHAFIIVYQIYFFNPNDDLFCTDVHADRAQSVDALLSPVPHPNLMTKNSNSVTSSISTTSTGND